MILPEKDIEEEKASRKAMDAMTVKNLLTEVRLTEANLSEDRVTNKRQIYRT